MPIFKVELMTRIILKQEKNNKLEVLQFVHVMKKYNSNILKHILKIKYVDIY
jgi:hypothetical protein